MNIDFEIYFGVGIVILAVIVSGVFMYMSEYSNNQSQNTGIANPASTNCIEQGGGLEVRDGLIGQYGLCHFSDGSLCEEWAFLRGECKVGDVFVDLTNCESYFDGCNNCLVLDGKVSVCTEMYCLPENLQEPKCLEYK